MDASCTQLDDDIRDSLSRSLAQRRPLLHHLNADTSWLLQLPQPSSVIGRGGRHWYNILIDPWLSGTQSDVASWVSQQWHASAPAFGSITAVEQLARDIETLSSESRYTGKEKIEGSSRIDAIVVSHEFTDHCHKETLLECDPDIPVFATTKAVQLIQSWRHFRLVLEAPTFTGDGADWRDISVPPLPDWLAIGKVINEEDALYYHSAILIAFDCKEKPRKRWSARYSLGGREEAHPSDALAEAVIYTPHGIDAAALDVIPGAEPRIDTLALLHGLHDVAISMQQLNMGAHNGLKAHRLLRPRFWFGTHDEVKHGSGIVGYFLKRKVISLEEALRLEEEAYKKSGDRTLADVRFRDLENGESIVLTGGTPVKAGEEYEERIHD